MAITKRELAARVLDQITNHPESWDQGTWWKWGDDQYEQSIRVAQVIRTLDECGTTGCVAGWTVALFLRDEHSDNALIKGPYIDTAAQQLLGLTYKAKSWLFRSSRTLKEVTEMLTAIANDDQDAITALCGG